MFYFIFDILNELAIISQNMQRREGLVIDIQTLKKNIDSILSYIKSNNGKHLELFLNEVQCVD